MNDIGRIAESLSSHPISPEQRYAGPRQAARTGRSQEDAVDVSLLGRLLSQLHALPDIRVEKVAEVRAAIEQGTYETPEKLERTIEKLLEELAG